MKKLWRTLAAATTALAFFGFGFTACSDGGSSKSSTAVTGVSVSADKTAIAVSADDEADSIATLTATIAPDNASNKGVTWSFSEGYDSYVEVSATTSKSGESITLTAKAAGTVTATATAAGDTSKTASVTITIIAEAVEATAASVSGTYTITLDDGDLTFTLKSDGTVVDEDGDEIGTFTLEDGVITVEVTGYGTFTAATTLDGAIDTSTVTDENGTALALVKEESTDDDDNQNSDAATLTVPWTVELKDSDTATYGQAAIAFGAFEQGANGEGYYDTKVDGASYTVNQNSDGLYFYANANGFRDGDSDGGLRIYYYGFSGSKYEGDTATVSSTFATANLRSYISLTGSQLTSAGATSIKLTIKAKKLESKKDDTVLDISPIIAILNSENNKVLEVKEVTNTDASSDYVFYVTPATALKIANGGVDGTHFIVYSIAAEASTEAVTATGIVPNPAASVALADFSLLVGAEKTISATVTGTDSTKDSTDTATYALKDATSTVITLTDNGDGTAKVVAGSSAGSAVIVVTAGSQSCETTVTVSAEAVAAETVTVASATGATSITYDATLETQETLTLNATVGPTGTTESVTSWESSAPTVASVSGSGNSATVTPVSGGTATITAKVNDTVKGTFTVTVPETVTWDFTQNSATTPAVTLHESLTDGVLSEALDASSAKENGITSGYMKGNSSNVNVVAVVTGGQVKLRDDDAQQNSGCIFRLPVSVGSVVTVQANGNNYSYELGADTANASKYETDAMTKAGYIVLKSTGSNYLYSITITNLNVDNDFSADVIEFEEKTVELDVSSTATNITPGSIATAADSSIATATLSGTKLTITSKAPGTTSVVLADSTTTANTATVSITVGTYGAITTEITQYVDASAVPELDTTYVYSFTTASGKSVSAGTGETQVEGTLSSTSYQSTFLSISATIQNTGHGVQSSKITSFTLKVPAGKTTITFVGCTYNSDATISITGIDVSQEGTISKGSENKESTISVTSSTAQTLTLTNSSGDAYIHGMKVKTVATGD